MLKGGGWAIGGGPMSGTGLLIGTDAWGGGGVGSTSGGFETALLSWCNGLANAEDDRTGGSVGVGGGLTSSSGVCSEGSITIADSSTAGREPLFAS